MVKNATMEKKYGLCIFSGLGQVKTISGQLGQTRVPSAATTSSNEHKKVPIN